MFLFVAETNHRRELLILGANRLPSLDRDNRPPRRSPLCCWLSVCSSVRWLPSI